MKRKRLLTTNICLIILLYPILLIKAEQNNNLSINFSKYTLRYGKCQRIKAYSDEVAQNEDIDGVFTVQQFVLFRLCPIDEEAGNNNNSEQTSSICTSDCSSNYGEYIVTMEDYLQLTTQKAAEDLQVQCQNCYNNYDSCPSECIYINNNNNNNNEQEEGNNYQYIDASEFIECQKVANDNYGNPIYAGPSCSSDGSSIRIRAYKDENCWNRISSDELDLKDLLGARISHHLFKYAVGANSEGTYCFSCQEGQSANYNNNEGDQKDEDQVVEVCEDLYKVAAKCESKHGMENGMDSSNYYYFEDNNNVQEYYVQQQNEVESCTFIDQIVWGSYDETGEINVDSDNPKNYDVIIRQVSSNQRIALTLLSITITLLSVVILYLHNHIQQYHKWLEPYTCRGVVV